MIIIAYLSWLPASLLAFKFAPRHYAPWICVFGGWVLLPPAVYPIPPSSGFPFWITGSSLPSDVLISKAWVAPLATCVASLIFDVRRWRSTPLNVWDACIGLFCLWPLIQNAIVGHSSPAAWASSLYLTGAWALPWWLGRLYLLTKGDAQSFAVVFTAAMLFLLPIAILEGASEMRVHTLLIGEHPFTADGLHRYVGYRPQALFENGNQYGLWCAAATVAAYWLAQGRALSFSIAGILAAMTVASQSVGAIGLMIFGSVALHWTASFAILYRFGVCLLLFAVVAACSLVAGLIPLREFVEQSGTGHALLEALRSTGRGSLAWRVSQDLKAAPLLREHLLIGSAQWDWFFPLNTRPWGFPLLVVGQFGLFGLALLLLPLLRAVSNALRQAVFGNETARLAAVLVIIAGLDAVLNSFLLWPFIVLASIFAGRGVDPPIQWQEKGRYNQ